MIKEHLNHPLKPFEGTRMTLEIMSVTSTENEDVVSVNLRLPKTAREEFTLQEYIDWAFWVIVRRGFKLPTAQEYVDGVERLRKKGTFDKKAN